MRSQSGVYKREIKMKKRKKYRRKEKKEKKKNKKNADGAKDVPPTIEKIVHLPNCVIQKLQ